MSFSLLFQACATTRVETTVIPGKEISSTLLGEREIDNNIVLEEITPLSVKLFRRVSKADFTRSEYQAIKETRRETTTYNCSSTSYREYVSIMVVTLGAALFYELATKFELLHDLCDKNPPSYVIETAATDKTLSRETYAKDKIVSSEIPLAGESVTAQFDGNSYQATTSPAGIATFSRAEVASLLNLENEVTVTYQYNDTKLATRIIRKDLPATVLAANPFAGPQQSWEVSANIAATPAGTDTTSSLQPLPYPHPEEEWVLSGFLPYQERGQAGDGVMLLSRTDIAEEEEWILSGFLPFQGEGQEGDGVIWPSRTNLAANAATTDVPNVPTGKADSMGMPGEQSVAKSTAAVGNLAAVTIGAESTADRPKTGEWKIVLQVKFDTNKATIRKEYYSRLQAIGETLKNNPQLTGVIEGHTDNVGSREFNQKISIRRAEAIAHHLIKTFAISAERLKVAGYGMSRPIAANSTPGGRAQNRRIEAKFKDLN